MLTWRTKPGADKAARFQHPWTFLKDIDNTGKNFISGSPVMLQDAKGEFLAFGYGNPESQIAFRAVTFNSSEKNYFTPEYLQEKVLKAWAQRGALGFQGSFRMVFSEADSLPGLIIDYYKGAPNGTPVQVLATQILTAGMQKWIGQAETFFQKLILAAREQGISDITPENSAVVLRNDVRSRKLEGLTEESPRFIKSVREADFTKFGILLNAATTDGLVQMDCDLFQGQKTGFFLDQTQNIQQVCRLAERLKLVPGQPVKVLDLCCYVGHWSTQLTRTLKARGFDVEVTQVDISARALAFARGNAEREGAKVNSLEGDLFKILPKLQREYDIVIADPPAFIKSKKDLHVGSHAYVKMNSQALRTLREGGLLVSCSCSGLLTEDLFKDTLKKALYKTKSKAQCLLRGGPAPDHPGRLEFPEGMYLKMFVHVLNQAGPAEDYSAAGAGEDETIGAEGVGTGPAAGEEFDAD